MKSKYSVRLGYTLGNCRVDDTRNCETIDEILRDCKPLVVTIGSARKKRILELRRGEKVRFKSNGVTITVKKN